MQQIFIRFYISEADHEDALQMPGCNSFNQSIRHSFCSY